MGHNERNAHCTMYNMNMNAIGISRTTLDRSAARAIRSFRRLTMASMTRAASSLRFCFSVSVRPSGRVLVSMTHSVPSLYPSGQMRGAPA